MNMQDYFDHQRSIYRRLLKDGLVNERDHANLHAATNEAQRAYDREVDMRRAAQAEAAKLHKAINAAVESLGGRTA